MRRWSLIIALVVLVGIINVALGTYFFVLRPPVQRCLARVEHRSPLPPMVRTAFALSLGGERQVRREADVIAGRIALQVCTDVRPAGRYAVVAYLMQKDLLARYSEDELLDILASVIYFGEGPEGPLYGIAEAAPIIIAKDISELGPADAALLASITIAPQLIIRRPDVALLRRNRLIDKMQSASAITAEQAVEAKKTPLPEFFRSPHGVAN